MNIRCLFRSSLLPSMLFLLLATPAVWGQEDLGKRRVQDMKGRWYSGQVTELPDAYKIKQDNGITTTLKKSEVKLIRSLVESTATDAASEYDAYETGNSLRRYVTDEEVSELLEGITIDTSDIIESGGDMLDELPVDEESLDEMKRLAGARDDQVMLKPHFALVFTSSEEEARRLAARLESVYRWNIKFLKMLDIPPTQPEHKLEIFYFGTHKEFEAYSVNTGGGPSGALGFYRPGDNRSAFFELSTFPPIAFWLEMAKDKRIPHKQRQIARNKLNQWVEFNNMEVIQHEAGHHIHFNIGLFPRDVFMDRDSFDSLPRWLVEGTTMMFEFPPTKAGASLGTVNHGRLDEFDKIYGRKDEHRRLSPQRLKTFILDNGVFLRGGHTTYSLGWALVYYCWKENRDGYAEYMKIISEREPGVDVSYTQREREFEDIFGRVDEDWIDDWYEFLDGLLLKRSVLPPEIRP
ncbi:MAG: DUF1570 domain-containing protein [Planctomycetota bacterium]